MLTTEYVSSLNEWVLPLPLHLAATDPSDCAAQSEPIVKVYVMKFPEVPCVFDIFAP